MVYDATRQLDAPPPALRCSAPRKSGGADADEEPRPRETLPRRKRQPENALPELRTRKRRAEPGLSAFAVLEPLPALPFADVPSGAWYHDAVQTLYALNLVSGVSSTAFSPSSALTAGQCAALSVRIYAAYHGAEIDVTQREGERWFDPWMRAARELDMLRPRGRAIDPPRAGAYLLYRTLPIQLSIHLSASRISP